MDTFILIKLVGIILLVMGNAYFVSAEIALTSARRSRVHHLAQKGDSSAKLVQLLQSEPERFYSVTQIGITLMSLGLGAIGISTITTILKPVIDLAVIAFSAVMSSASAHYAAKTSVQVFAFIFISALLSSVESWPPKFMPSTSRCELASLSRDQSTFFTACFHP